MFLIGNTFGVKLSRLAQILTINKYLGKSYPIFCVFLENKKECYNNCFFLEIKEKFNFKSSFIIIDFEKALINASKKVYRNKKQHSLFVSFLNVYAKDTISKFRSKFNIYNSNEIMFICFLI